MGTSALCLVTGYNSGQRGLEIVGQEKRSGYNHRSRPVTMGMERQENVSSKGATIFTARKGSLGGTQNRGHRENGGGGTPRQQRMQAIVDFG